MKPNGVTFNRVWRNRCAVEPINRREADEMIRKHYLGKWPGVCVLSLGLFVDQVPKGVVVFALPPIETSKRYGKFTWELARLWVCDSMPVNTESYFIARAIRYIRKQHKNVGMLVSYADPSAQHTGVIYKASNWRSDGKTDQDRKTPRFDYACANTGKVYSRRKHVPENTLIVRIPRISKYRFTYDLMA